MKKIIFTVLTFLSLNCLAVESSKETRQALLAIKNFQFVSDELASSGMLDMLDYRHIKHAGYKHVINLIPGNQLKERKVVESYEMSYEQIPVDWENPTLADFEQFTSLMQSYGEDRVYVHCQLSWRASAFVYLYRVTQLGVPKQQARETMLEIWTPEGTWESFIDKVERTYAN